MTRSDWTELPRDIRALIQGRTGKIRSVHPAPDGNHANIASAVRAEGGMVFVKAAKKLPERDGAEVASLRREAAINPHVALLAPRLLWTVEAGEWLALGFEHVRGRQPSFEPGSPDLEMLAATIERLQAWPCPEAVTSNVEQRWINVTDDVSAMAGTALLHTDLNPANFIITPERVYLADWAFVSRGAAWLELGLLIPWLLYNGHSAEEAEEWISRFPSWNKANREDIDRWSRAFALLWERRSKNFPSSWATALATLAQRWATYRRV
jgi:hypothetical protein